MSYTVISPFCDLKDKMHPYNVGDKYPRDGYTPSLERIAELKSDANALKMPLIKGEEKPSDDVESTAPKTTRAKRGKKKETE